MMRHLLLSRRLLRLVLRPLPTSPPTPSSASTPATRSFSSSAAPPPTTPSPSPSPPRRSTRRPCPSRTRRCPRTSTPSPTGAAPTRSTPASSSIEALQDAHKERRKLRPLGSGLSRNGLALTRAGMVNLALMDKVLDVDVKRKSVTVQAGIRVAELVDALREHGLTLQNSASIREQQVGGFTQVGAHGTGARLPPVDEQLISMKLVTPAKGTIELSNEKDPELFYLARCGLGGLGVVPEVILQIEAESNDPEIDTLSFTELRDRLLARDPLAVGFGSLSKPTMKDLDYMENLLQLIEKEDRPAPPPIEQHWTARSKSPMSPVSSSGEDDIFSLVDIIMYLRTSDAWQRKEITEEFFSYRSVTQTSLSDQYSAYAHWAKIEVPKDKDELPELQARLRERFPVDAYNKALMELDPNKVLSNAKLEKLFPVLEHVHQAK
ncbi:hypothetical protein PR202_ga04054 [Eleusine coracana subsp. coracana]|uniref:FAD-binding PCMH-type domain-containing protein n=1 Tax=Eleusine coracana subsp. coracana TaxID=191504 RepID=A0AAV5BNN3_ELECO|nr:hypothetical protein PR202_ga04054 [Eleusine coracana subsp. coracana]